MQFESTQYQEALDNAITKIKYDLEISKAFSPEDFHSQHEAYAVIKQKIELLWDSIKNTSPEYKQPQRAQAINAAAMLVKLIVELL